MKEWYFRTFLVPLLMIVPGLLFLCFPGSLDAQSVSEFPVRPPPIAAQFVPQGDFAAALAYILGLTDGRDHVQAEDRLASLGIAPKNGWISDDPVTPDIVGDLETATAQAADANLLPLSRDEALGRFIGVVQQSGLAISPGTGAYASAGPMAYPDQEDITDYYVSQGAPLITYYEPPPAYYYLYSWVPYSFWYGGTAFPGYYVLRDHHRHGHHGGSSGGHASKHGQGGTGRHHPADQGYRFSGSAQGHSGSRPVGSHHWRQEATRSTVNATNYARNRMSGGIRPVMPAVPRVSGRPEHSARGAYRNPFYAVRPRMDTGTRSTQHHAFRPSSPTGSVEVRQRGASREASRMPSASGWTRGGNSGQRGTGFGGRGFAGVRR